MKAEDKLKQKYGSDPGFRVPEDYFDTVFVKISSELPEYPEAQTIKTLSRWQRIKPYVYLAAMFAGIWCTMKMVNMMSNSQQEVSLDNPPAIVAQAMDSPEVLAQVTSQPSVMVIDDFEEDLDMFEDDAAVSGDVADENAQEALNFQNSYDTFINVDDIDLGELQAALEEDDDEYYAYAY
ncbi:MAG: hypothetical protein NC217_02285 [Muribaculaceae bacterium]|nr:hypothetical protein [Muribaculaceae bacterium]